MNDQSYEASFPKSFSLTKSYERATPVFVKLTCPKNVRQQAQCPEKFRLVRELLYAASRFWDSKRADHRRATEGVEKSKWMKQGRAESQNAQPQVVLNGLLTEGNSEQKNDDYARRDRSAFKVLHFTGCRIR